MTIAERAFLLQMAAPLAWSGVLKERRKEQGERDERTGGKVKRENCETKLS
jgi:hypothetical protein